MQRSQTIRYRISTTLASDEHVEITLVRENSTDRITLDARYAVDLALAPNTVLDPTIFNRRSGAIYLEATFSERTREIWIPNIEGRGLERGQAFARNTFTQLLEITPECETMVLYNITNHRAASAVDRARDTPSWSVPPDGTLLRALYDCGFQKVVGFVQGGPAYRCVRASHRHAA